jgi:hypothetical protein
MPKKYKAGLTFILYNKPDIIFQTDSLWLFKIAWPILKLYAKYNRKFLLSLGTPTRMP